MTKTLHITDHALLRYVERVHGLDVEAMRMDLQARATRAATAAGSIGGGEFRIHFDDMTFRCANDHVITIVTRGSGK